MDKHGQTLVEVALIFPLFLFVIAGLFWLLALGHDAIVLQEAAARSARFNALKERSDDRLDPGFLRSLQVLRKRLAPGLHKDRLEINPWRPFKGFETSRLRGSMIRVETRGYLPGGRFLIGSLPPVSLRFASQLPAEPPIPEAP